MMSALTLQHFDGDQELYKSYLEGRLIMAKAEDSRIKYINSVGKLPKQNNIGLLSHKTTDGEPISERSDRT